MLNNKSLTSQKKFTNTRGYQIMSKKCCSEEKKLQADRLSLNIGVTGEKIFGSKGNV